MEPRLTPLLGLACPDKAKDFRLILPLHKVHQKPLPVGLNPTIAINTQQHYIEPKLSVVDLWSANIQRRAGRQALSLLLLAGWAAGLFPSAIVAHIGQSGRHSPPEGKCVSTC